MENNDYITDDEEIIEEDIKPIRTLAYKRYQRHRAISRKKNICHKRDGSDWYKHDGQYSKGKIHCGCGICKFGRKYGPPTFKTIRETAKFKDAIKDYNSSL